MVRRIKQIQTIVEKLLTDAQLTSRTVDVESIAARHNIQIHREDLEDISGLIYRDGNQVTIGVNNKESSNRQRFTIAHELGHYFLHTQNPLFIDKVFAVRRRDQLSSEAVSIEEIEANAFAAELLMPTRLLAQELSKLPHVQDYERDDVDDLVGDLAGKFSVSKQAMRNRLSNLGFFPETF
jgi:Zn-dependent peptidase ImmA (M78 family)